MRPTPVFHHACPAHFYYAIDMMGALEGKREGNISPPKSDEFLSMRASATSLPTPPYNGPTWWAEFSRKTGNGI